MNIQLKEYLSQNGIKYKIYEHPAVFTVEESKKLTSRIPGLRTKSLFLKGNYNNFYLVCMPGTKRLNIKFLKKRFGIAELHFGSPEELKRELNITPGSVSLFCMINAKNTFLIIDKEVWDAKISGFHPNINTSTIVLEHANLRKFYDSLNCRREILILPQDE